MIYPTLLAREGEKDRAEAGEGLRLERRRDGRLWARRRGGSRPVRIRALFPWSSTSEHVSLRDDDDREVALVADAGDLEPRSGAALDGAMDVTAFVLEVRSILEIEEEVEIRVWRVETRQGTRTFQTRLDDWPWEVPGGGWLIRDVAGDLYRLPGIETLDERSRELLWGFVG